jgi:hypothetical protein
MDGNHKAREMGRVTKLLRSACLFFHGCVVFPAPTCGRKSITQFNLELPNPAFSVACGHVAPRERDWPLVCNQPSGMFT